jgi:hypothetical protein
MPPGRTAMATIRVYARLFKISFIPSSAGSSVLGIPSDSPIVAPGYSFEPFGPCTFDNSDVEKRGFGAIMEAGPKFKIDIEVPGNAQIKGASLISLKIWRRTKFRCWKSQISWRKFMDTRTDTVSRKESKNLKKDCNESST